MKMNIERKPMVLKIAVLGLLVAVGAAWLVSPGKAKAEQKAPVAGRAALTVRTTVLREEKWSRSIAANGSIIPWQEAVISTPLAGLRIAEVLVSVGDHVKQGDVLVTLDYMARSPDQGGAAAGVQGRIVSPDAGVIS